MTITNKIKAVDLNVGDIFAYCGATYEVTYLDTPDRYGMIFMKCIKRLNGTIISDNFHMSRFDDDDVALIS